jgi:hypothetical protein
VAHPWRRYGHHRVYLRTNEGLQVGWVDCIAQVAHLETPAYAAEFAAAVSGLIPMHRKLATADSPEPAAQKPSLLGTPVLHGDLASNRPGDRVAKAERAQRDAAPIRSRLARLCGVDTQERHWRLGRQGEEAVAARLARLPSEWRVLHAIEVGASGSDIDHLVIGPGGVYTVNSKHHPDAAVWVGGDCFMVDGHRQPYIRNSRHEAARAARILSKHAGFPVPVVGLIAVMGARRGFTVKAQPADGNVYVVARKQVDTWLRRRIAISDAPEISAIYDVARRPQIWLT